MPPFEITEPTWATITSYVARTEKHGDEDKHAISFGVSIPCGREFIETLGIGLADAIFVKVENAQEPLPGVEAPTVWALRSPVIDHLVLDKKLEGWTVTVAHGLDGADEDSELKFGGSKVDKWKLMVGLRESETLCRVGTSDIDAVKAGEMQMLVGQQIQITMKAPVVKHTIDASSGSDAPRSAGPDDLFGDGDGDHADGAEEADHQYQPIDALIDGADESGVVDAEFQEVGEERDLQASDAVSGEIVDNDPLGVGSGGEASQAALDAAGDPFAAGPEAAAAAPARRSRRRATTAAE